LGVTGRETLFSGENVELVLNGDPTDASLCVTFSPLIRKEQPALTGFAEKFLSDRNVPTLHFITKRNHWWQVADMEECVKFAQPAIDASKRRVGYGSSMGAFGAIKFSRDLKLHAIAAFAPQFSPDPAKVPWEKRWMQFRNQLESFDHELATPKDCKVYVFYDPNGPDALHANLIAEATDIERIELPEFGHLALRKLKECGCLEPILMGLIRNSTNREDILKVVEIAISRALP
jgi:hypothetical protein